MAIIGPSGDSIDLNPKWKSINISVYGMTCASCVSSLEKALLRIPAIHKVEVSLMASQAKIDYDSSTLSPSEIIEHIEDIGFDASMNSNPQNHETSDRAAKIASLTLDVVPFRSTENGVADVLRSISGVVGCYERKSDYECVYDQQKVGVRRIMKVLLDNGYKPTIVRADDHYDRMKIAQSAEIEKWRTAFSTSALFGIPSMLVMFVFMFAVGHARTPFVIPGLGLDNMIMFMLACPVQYLVGKYFFKKAYGSLKKARSANMDVLLCMASLTAFVYSVVDVVVSMILANFAGRPAINPMTFFDVTPMLVMFVSLGRWLENLAKRKTSDAITQLLSLKPTDGIVLLPEAKTDYLDISSDFPGTECIFNAKVYYERNVAFELIELGDYVKILPGAKVPVDGVIIEGGCSVDESLLTGESMPVYKTKGDSLIGGTMNQRGTALIKATHVGADTALSQIVKLIENAQTNKAPIQSLADRISGYFVPGVILLSLLTLASWLVVGALNYDFVFEHSRYNHQHSKQFAEHLSRYEVVFETAFRFAISVLAISCPCALGLATPTAVMVGTGVGARNGILIKGGVPLETAHKVKVIVFDKTGTLTRGEARVIKFKETSNVQQHRIGFSTISAIEKRSEHILARAIVDYCGVGDDESGDLSSFDSHSGLGVSATIIVDQAALEVFIGSFSFMREMGVSIDHSSLALATDWENDGLSVVWVAVQKQVNCLFAVSDLIKPEAREVVRILKSRGIEVIMLTGDRRSTAENIGRQAGIEKVIAEVRPAEKAKVIESLQLSKRKKIAMVGDGVNDSPALAQADLGIGIGSGADIAAEAADIVLMKSDLLQVAAAIDLSAATIRTIRRNFVFATVYNAIAIPVAAGLLLPINISLMPWMASAAMAASSLSVVTSSLWLRRWKKSDVIALAEYESSSLDSSSSGIHDDAENMPFITAGSINRTNSLRPSGWLKNSFERKLTSAIDCVVASYGRVFNGNVRYYSIPLT